MNRPPNLPLFVAAILLSLASVAFAQRSARLERDVFEIQDGGMRRSYEVAADEIQIRDAARRTRVVRIPRQKSAEAVRVAAEVQLVAMGEEAELILYEAGAPHTEANRRTLTKRILVRLRAGADPEALAGTHALVYSGAAPFLPNAFFFEATKTGGALAASESLRVAPEVESAEPQLARQHQKRFTPNDPLYPQQWHLKNTGQGSGVAGIDVNNASVWDSYKGAGIRIAIVDDGIELTHPDLSPNLDTVNDHDWNDATPDDPSPNLFQDEHGTSCAGVAAARGNNGIGVSGAAP